MSAEAALREADEYERQNRDARLARDLLLSLIRGSGMLPHPDEHRTVAREARLLAETFYAEIANPTARPQQRVDDDEPADVVALEDEGI